MKLNLDYLLEMIWEHLALLRIYTKKRGGECFYLYVSPLVQIQHNGLSQLLFFFNHTPHLLRIVKDRILLGLFQQCIGPQIVMLFGRGDMGVINDY